MVKIGKMLEEFLNIKAIASYLDLKRSTLYTLVEEKRIPHYRIGKQIRFKLSEIEEWLEKCKEPVVGVKVEAKKVIKSFHTRPNLDVDRIVKKSIDEAKGRRYTSGNGKPDQVSDLRKEA